MTRPSKVKFMHIIIYVLWICYWGPSFNRLSRKKQIIGEVIPIKITMQDIWRNWNFHLMFAHVCKDMNHLLAECGTSIDQNFEL